MCRRLFWGEDTRLKRRRSNCPNGATHTSPGHRSGNRVRENRCVLKEHRIGGDVQDTESMRRSFRTRVCYFDFFGGGARVVMPLTGGGVAMGERGGERREKQRYIWLLAADS